MSEVSFSSGFCKNPGQNFYIETHLLCEGYNQLSYGIYFLF